MGQADLGAYGEADRRADADAEARAVAGDGDGHEAPVVDTDSARYPEADGHVDLAVTQVDYTVEGHGGDERPVVHVFGRTAENDAVHVRVHEFRPYFYAPTDTLEEGDLALDAITGSEAGFESIRGEDLTRIYGRTPRDVGQIRDRFEHFEADILFPDRFLIDKDIRSGIRVPVRRSADGALDVHHAEVEAVEADADLRVLTLDIEVDDRRGFPEDGEEPIICLSTHDSYRDEYIAWLYESPGGDGTIPDGLPGYDLVEDRESSVDLRTFDAEDAMLAEFLDYLDETDPDIATGWNVDDFDAPYLIDRLERLDGHSEHDLDYDRLSRVNEVWADSDWSGPTIKGRVLFDLLDAYRRTQFSELDSYKLDDIGEQELGVGKERYPGKIGDLWEDDPERLLEYNVRDVELCVEIDRQQQVIPFWEEVADFVGCRLEDAPTPGDTVDMYVLHKAYGRFVLPSKGQQESEDFEGGAVFDPISGVRDNVSVLDLASLYPMSMSTLNASPETKVDPETYDGETYVAPNGQHFRKEPDGIMREMINELLAERDEKKSLRDEHDPGTDAYETYDQQQGAVKVLMNCFTPDTDVLTPSGIRSITELEVGDDVYSLDPNTLTMEVKPVTETHAYPEYRDELIDIQTDKIDFRVTPNHRMLVLKGEQNGISWDDYQFVEAGELDKVTNYRLPHNWDGPDGEPIDSINLCDIADGEWEVWVRPGVHGHTFAAELGWYPDTSYKDDRGVEGYVLSKSDYLANRDYIDSVSEATLIHREANRKWIPSEFDGDDFLKLLAWYITEGSVYTSKEKQFGEKLRGSATTIQLAQERVATDGGEDDHSRIGALLDRMGFDYFADERSYQFTSRLLGETLEQLCGDENRTKQIPEIVFEASQEQKEKFLGTLVAGDGDWTSETAWRFTTSSESLRDDVLRLCTHLGLTANYRWDSGSWRIYCSETSRNTLRMHRSSSQSTATEGVYCVTIADNHTILAGRNGKFQFVGQSLYGVSGWDRFRLYDKENAAAITATGRAVIEFTEEAANELNKNVTYGDTDSVMLQLGDISKADAIEEAFAIEDHINDRYDEFARDELNAEFHRFEIEFEKLYRRFFQAGKKKRYAGHIVWKEGKDVDDIDIVGFEYQRSDIAPITKEVQLEVIDRIVRSEADIETVIEDVTEYVRGVIEDFESGEIPIEEVAIPGGIGKRLDNYETDTAHVRGSKYANLLLGTNIDRGDKPMRLYLEKVHPSYFERIEAERGLDPAEDPLYGAFKRDPDVICLEYADQLPEEFRVHWEKMLDRTLQGPISRILEALDVTWEEVRSGQEQTGLGQYM